jgi:hypothetical protein
MACVWVRLDTGLVYKINMMGPNTDPWGTPKESEAGWEVCPSTRTVCVLPRRYDANQSSAEPEIPYSVLRRESKILWSIVSKAALKSSKVSIDTFPSSNELRTSLQTFTRAVSVL